MKLTPREEEILADLPTDEWVRPMDIGGRDASDHSAVLTRLVEKGYAERKRRYVGFSSGSYLYRRKP